MGLALALSLTLGNSAAHSLMNVLYGRADGVISQHRLPIDFLLPVFTFLTKEASLPVDFRTTW